MSTVSLMLSAASSPPSLYRTRCGIGTYFPKKISSNPATQYLFALADKNGDELQAGKTYSFTMPAEVPVEQFLAMLRF